MKGLFVTGTDTGVGKTQIAAAVAQLLSEAGVSVRPRKPVETGCRADEDGLTAEDALTLKAAANSRDALAVICPYMFKPAVSPERAARLCGQQSHLADLIKVTCAEITASDYLLVEGAGGFCSPLASDGLNADLAAALALPVLLVVRNRLGCLNHALLTVEAVRQRNLNLAGIVLNQVDAVVNLDMDNADDLKRWLACPVLYVPHMTASSPWPEMMPFIRSGSPSLFDATVGKTGTFRRQPTSFGPRHAPPQSRSR